MDDRRYPHHNFTLQDSCFGVWAYLVYLNIPGQYSLPPSLPPPLPFFVWTWPPSHPLFVFTFSYSTFSSTTWTLPVPALCWSPVEVQPHCGLWSPPKSSALIRSTFWTSSSCSYLPCHLVCNVNMMLNYRMLFGSDHKICYHFISVALYPSSWILNSMINLSTVNVCLRIFHNTRACKTMAHSFLIFVYLFIFFKSYFWGILCL